MVFPGVVTAFGLFCWPAPSVVAGVDGGPLRGPLPAALDGVAVGDVVDDEGVEVALEPVDDGLELDESGGGVVELDGAELASEPVAPGVVEDEELGVDEVDDELSVVDDELGDDVVVAGGVDELDIALSVFGVSDLLQAASAATAARLTAIASRLIDRCIFAP